MPPEAAPEPIRGQEAPSAPGEREPEGGPEESGAAAEADEPPAGLTFREEVVVTANRREQSLQDVPAAVSLISSRETKDLRLRTLHEVVELVPNADIKDALPGFSQSITIRGVGQNDFGFLNTSSVGVYVDDVHLASPGQFGLLAFDLERVEVLRGPQGTLYGRNTTGGAVNIRTMRPSRERSGYLSAGLGTYDSIELEGALGGSLGGSWSGRLSGRLERQGESFHFNRLTNDHFGRTQTLAARGQLAYARDNFNVNLALHYLNADGAHVPYEQRGLLDRSSVEAILNDPELGAPVFAAFGAPRCEAAASGRFDATSCVNVHGYSDGDGDPRSHDAHTTDGLSDVDQLGVTLSINRAFGSDLTLTSITGYQSFDSHRTEDQSGPLVLFAPRIHGWLDQLSQELRLAGRSRRVDWIGGLYFSFDRAHERATDSMDDFSSTRLFSLDDQDTVSYAAFANLDWRWGQRWTLNAGARLTHEERSKRAESTDLNPFGSSALLGLLYEIDPTSSGTVTYASTDSEISHTDVSGRLGLEYRPSDDWLLYLSASRASKSGGWITGIVFEQPEMEPFGPEELLSYELGFKGDIGANLLLNGALFYYDYESIQSFIQSSVGFRLGNIDGARGYGGELELVARPAPNLSLRGGLGLLDTEMSSFMGADGLVPKGNEQPNAPTANLSGLARYEIDLSRGLSLALQTDIRYQSGMFRSADNDPLTRTDAHLIVNGRIAFGPSDRGWELALWGKNLADEDFVYSGFNVPILGIVAQVYNPPRTLGVSFTWRP